MAIQIRRGTNAEWESNNSNIVVGEPAIATDEERFFVGTDSGAFAEFANLDIIAPAYDTSTSYEVGDVINRQGKLYSCNTPCSGAFNASYWDEKSLTEILKDLENEIDYAQYEIGYASGKLITVGNGASEIPVKDLTLDIEAVQDLHGYDHPWVGGAGKNLLNPYVCFTSELRYTINADESITILRSDGRAWSGVEMLPLNAGTYTFSRESSIGECDIRLSTENYETMHLLSGTTKTLTFTMASDGYVKIKAGYSGGDNYPFTDKLQIEAGSPATAWTPYSNICPISGWTGANVFVNGINQWDEEWESGTYDASGAKGNNANYIRSSNNIAVLPNTEYCIAKTAGKAMLVCEYDINGTFIRRVFTTTSQETAGYLTYTTTIETYYITFAIGGSSTPVTTYNHDISINYPSTDHDYHAYNGTTYSVTWQTEAGTVYGGTLDVTTGELVVDKAEVDFGDINWTYYSSGNYFYAILADRFLNAQSDKGTGLCSAYGYFGNGTSSNLQNNMPNGMFGFTTSSSYKYVYVKNFAYTNATTFKTDMTGQKIIYTLATPQTYQLTPTQVRTLLGTNNLWNSMNSNNELVYRISNALN